MEPKLLNLTLGEARRFAEPATALIGVPESLSEELRHYGVDDYYLVFPEGRLTETVLFNYGFDSDEVAAASVFSLDGREFMLAEKYGDRSDWVTQVLDLRVFREFIVEAARISLESRLQGLGTAESDPDQIQLGGYQNNFNGYVAFSETPHGAAVHFLSPKWGSYRWMFNHHPALHDGAPVEFVRWLDDRRSWQIRPDEADVLLRWQDGTERAVAGWRTAFLLEPSRYTQAQDPCSQARRRADSKPN